MTEAPYTDPEALLQARVLKILKPCRGYWLDELRDKAYIDFRVDPLSRLTEWRLTPSGNTLAQPL